MTSKFDIILKKEERSNANRSKFRKLARDVCREVCDIPENNKVIFMYEKRHYKVTLIGEISYQLSDLTISNPGTNFDNEFYNQITFMFLKEDFQLQGLGRKMFKEAYTDIRSHDQTRPIRVQSAHNAIGFFEKLGFQKIGEPIETICGISIFRILQNMELTD